MTILQFVNRKLKYFMKQAFKEIIWIACKFLMSLKKKSTISSILLATFFLFSSTVLQFVKEVNFMKRS